MHNAHGTACMAQRPRLVSCAMQTELEPPLNDAVCVLLEPLKRSLVGPFIIRASVPSRDKETHRAAAADLAPPVRLHHSRPRDLVMLSAKWTCHILRVCIMHLMRVCVCVWSRYCARVSLTHPLLQTAPEIIVGSSVCGSLQSDHE